ncbi:CobW family GTP-binding protein [Clostridium tarantellae]|uniref:GTP-binding protein n=1 Tax=Clostridium tarantellae TaxID=39493 RepID=A0A6I1MIQ9_9CLOT|nr:GTP-binding protein [Clostridium tarantellae]MPQ42573.1 GTP-binding protein [Clostridium tarantellae]
MKIDIISGFLGAGKTTLIKKLISEELKHEKIAIIENEYGEVGIDGGLLKDIGLEVKEITSGCICCNITGDFKESLKLLVNEYRPERIIIEPSGVAKLSEIINSINSAKIEGSRINMKIAVVDAQNIELYSENFGEFYKNQILSAKTIILSRSEKLSQIDLDRVCSLIKDINKKCKIITNSWNGLSSKKILEVAEDKVESLIEHREFKVINNKKSKVVANDVFDNWGIETNKIYSINKIKEALNKLEQDRNYGQVLRVKGIVKSNNNNWIKFDYVPNEFKIEDYNIDYTGKICVIGKNLNKENIKKLFLN